MAASARLTGRVVQTFEDPVSRDFPESLFQQSVKLQSIYQKAIPLRPGLYRLDIVIKDVQSGNVGVVNSRLQVPRYEDDKLESSSLILADQIEHVPSKQIGSGQFVLGSTKVRPRLEGEFTTAEKLGIYMQVYNLKPDDKTHKSNATFRIHREKGRRAGDAVQGNVRGNEANRRSGHHRASAAAGDAAARANIRWK